MNNLSRIIVLLGPPGSGKGTQAARLAQTLGIAAISTGELLRRECDSDSAIGRQVHSLLAAGFLVGNDLMNEIVSRRLQHADCIPGCILDGYPRTIEQARFLDEALASNGLQEPVIFDFIVSPDAAIERLSQRRQCPACGHIYSAEFDVYGKDLRCDKDGAPLVRRNDDNPDAIRERLEIYRHNTHDLVSFYQLRRYHALDAMQSPDAIAQQLMSLMLAEASPNVLLGTGVELE